MTAPSFRVVPLSRLTPALGPAHRTRLAIVSDPIRPSAPPSVPPDASGGTAVLLRFCTLGAALVEVGRVAVTPASGLLFSLLVRLAHTPGMGVTRERLVAELWPGHDPIRQRANLRQALYKLRAMGVRVTVGGEVVSLDPRQVAPSFSMERTAARFEEQVLAGGEPIGRFLPGMTAERGEFAEWLEVQRGLVQGEARRVLVDTLRRRRDRGDFGGTEVVARALLQLDPLNEEATLLLAECTLLAGARAEGVQLLDRYLAEVGEVPEEVRRRVVALRRRIHEPQPGVSRVRETPLSDALFVGREGELAQLSQALRRARWQDGGAMLVHGAPGIGKSRLATEVGRVAQLEGFREVRLSCREGDEGSGFHLLATLVSQLLALPGALGCSPEGLRRLRRQWPDGDCGAVLPVAGPALIDAVEQAATREALVDLVTAIAEERPLLVVVEDVHWLDAGSWQVLQLFAGAATGIRLFLLFTARERDPHQLRAVALAPRLGVLALGPLAAESAAQLAGALLGAGHGTPVGDAPREAPVAARLAAASQGNPLFLRALVQHWTDTGEAEGIPRTLTGLLETRMNRLPEGARLALQVIVLLGPLATTERLVSVLGVATSALVEALEALTAADCIRSAPPNHVMSHELVGRAALARLSVAGRAVLHGAIADVLAAERERTGAPALLLPVLEQLMLAGRWAEWGTVLVAAQDQVLALGNPAPVLAHAETVKGHAPGMLAAPGVRGVLAQLQAQAGNYEASLRLAGDVTGLAGRIAELEEREAAAFLTYLESAYHSQSSADHRFLAIALAELAENPRISDRRRLTAALRGLVGALNSSDSSVVDRCFHVASTLGREVQDSIMMTEFLMVYECETGSHASGEALAYRLLGSLNRTTASTETATLLTHVGMALRRCGNLLGAIAALEEAFQMFVKLNLRHLSVDCLVTLSSIARSIGDSTACLKWEALLYEIVSSQRDKGSVSNCLMYLCRAAVESGNRSLYRELQRELEMVYPNRPSPAARLHKLTLDLAEQLTWMDNPVSEDLVDRALHAYQNNQRGAGFNDFPVSVLARALGDMGRTAEAHQLVIDYATKRRRYREPLSMCLREVAADAGLTGNSFFSAT
jgi:DNA-binding SARP family transcriptional activator